MNGISHTTPGEVDPQSDGDEALTDDALDGVSGGASKVSCSRCHYPVTAICASYKYCSYYAKMK